MTEDVDSAVERALGRKPGAPEFDPKGADEFGEPDQGVKEVHDGDLARPMIGSLIFTGTDKDGDFDDVVREVIKIAEGLGLFYLAAFTGPMERDEVIPGSPLDQALTGRG